MPATQGGSSQQVKEHEELEHQRRAADQLDVAGENSSQRPRPVQPADGDQEPQRHGQGHRRDREHDRHAGRVEAAATGTVPAGPSRRRSVGRLIDLERTRESSSARVWASVQIPYFS